MPWEPTKTPPVELLRVRIPRQALTEALAALERLGATVERSIPAEEVLDLSPSAALRGARYREGLTQKELSALCGIPVRHISDMERGRRPIGKATARKLAAALKVDYRVFL